MKPHWIGAFAATLMASGCSLHGVSGTYIAKGQGFAEMLQITQGREGQLLGSLSSTTLNPNGSISQGTTNISGVANGHAVTLVAKLPIPLFPAINLPGTIHDGVITITNPNGQEQFTSGSPSDYAAAVQYLQAQGRTVQDRKHAVDEDAAVATVNKQLTDYAALVTQPKSEQQLSAFHTLHAKALARAQHGLDTQGKYPKNSVEASQVDVAIIQVQVELQGYDVDWNGFPEQGRSNIHRFDTAIAQSVCHTNTTVRSCADQPAAVQVYQSVRPLVLRRCDDIESTLKNDDRAMRAIVAQANAYLHN